MLRMTVMMGFAQFDLDSFQCQRLNPRPSTCKRSVLNPQPQRAWIFENVTPLVTNTFGFALPCKSWWWILTLQRLACHSWPSSENVNHILSLWGKKNNLENRERMFLVWNKNNSAPYYCNITFTVTAKKPTRLTTTLVETYDRPSAFVKTVSCFCSIRAIQLSLRRVIIYLTPQKLCLRSPDAY